ncbi:Plat domain-containing protein [Thalictrum thalictroides]|uniref:Plat domain-containing protein n=1 Tax=Thalictrum thalictroides TaxID=46969 RepID=A0A7J6UW42_THATH|nr:Plat domain-containing protein [Thalictrum thalictroides]
MVKTGTVDSAGTDSKISVILKDAKGSQVNIPNLVDYGKMGPGHDYFENGNLDTFKIETICMESSVCSLTLTSDGTGPKPGWYVDYVQVLTNKAAVTTKGNSSTAAGDNITFEIYGWLATDEPPYSLTRTFNKCGQSNAMI